MPLFATILLLQQIVALLERVFILRVIVDRVAVAFLLRLLLFVWGFVRRAPRTRRALTPLALDQRGVGRLRTRNVRHHCCVPLTQRRTPSFKVMPGHVIYANYVSYIEFLWLAFRCGTSLASDFDPR